MFSCRKLARRFLEDATLTDFNEIIQEAKISDEDAEVLVLKFVRGWSNVQIAMYCNMTLEKVNRTIKKSYEKVYRLM